MKAKNKELYQSPATAVVELKTQGIICQSGGVQNYNWNTIDPE